MATEIMLGADFFTNGILNNNRWLLGHDANGNAVVRYKFHTPPEGANTIRWIKEGTTEYDGTPRAQGEELRFYIGTDPNSHINAGQNAEYHGTAVALSPTAATFSMRGDIHGLLLLPDTDYYLFIFPGFSSYGLYYWDRYWGGMSIILEGAAGVVHININGDIVVAQPYAKVDGILHNAVGYTKIKGENKVLG